MRMARKSRIQTTVTEHPREFAHPVFGSDGMLFGTSAVGGKYGHGGVYRLHPDTPDEAEAITYYSGPRDEVGAIAGSGPSRLVPVGGELFGVTRYGGSKGGGTIFRISSEGRAETVHGLDDASNGHHPMSLMLASDGWLWGGLEEGGAAGKGGVFRFHPGTLQYELLFSCSGPDDPIKSGFGCRRVFEARPGYFLFAAGGWEIGSRRAIFSFQGAGPTKLVHVFRELDAPGDVGDIRGFATSADGKIYFVTELGGENDIGTIQRLNLDGSP